MPGGRAGAEVALLQGRAGQATHAQRQRRPGGLWVGLGTGLKTTAGERVKATWGGKRKRQSGVPFVGWAKGMIASGGGPPLVPPSVIADTARSTRAPDPLCLCLLVAACCRATPLARFHATPGVLQMEHGLQCRWLVHSMLQRAHEMRRGA